MEKLLGEKIIPNLKAKFNEKVDKTTYDAELESILEYLRKYTETEGWSIDLVKRNLKAIWYLWGIADIQLTQQTVTFNNEPTGSYDYIYQHIAHLLDNAPDRSNVARKLEYKRFNADGSAIDTAWQTADASKLVIVNDKSYVITRLTCTISGTVTYNVRVGDYFTPGMVPEWLSYPILTDKTNPSGIYKRITVPVYSNFTETMGTYAPGESFTYEMKYTFNSAACDNSNLLVSQFGVVAATGTTSTGSQQAGYGINFRIV